ncbi:MAG: twin-arginine translocation signal domain-containing protein, partial [Pseudomonadota bacterium]|nr:twin-arginine translocation signal domain-containing protein [Pseudomonadota bacterium]
MNTTVDNSKRNFLKATALAGGAAALTSCATSSTAPAMSGITHSQIPSFYPQHNERTKGWLRFLWQKA